MKLESEFPEMNGPSEDSFVARLQYLRGSESGRDFANRVGIPNSTMQKYLDGAATPGLDNFLLIARKLNVTLDWLAWGEGPMRPTDLIAVHGEAPDGFVAVPRLAVRPQAGAGALALQDDEPDIVAFREDWLRRIGVSPAYARLMVAKGDSMRPTINDGDLMVIDISVREPVDEGIYVLVVGGLVRLKRIQLLRSGVLLLKSDNPLYETETVEPRDLSDLMFGGRVKWSGGLV